MLFRSFMLKYVNNKNFESEVLNSERVVLVDFFATWCGPCQMLSPVLETIANSRAEFDIAKVDIDQAQELAKKYNIQVVPTMVIFKDGNAKETIQGFLSQVDIVAKVAKYI